MERLLSSGRRKFCEDAVVCRAAEDEQLCFGYVALGDENTGTDDFGDPRCARHILECRSDDEFAEAERDRIADFCVEGDEERRVDQCDWSALECAPAIGRSGGDDSVEGKVSAHCANLDESRLAAAWNECHRRERHDARVFRSCSRLDRIENRILPGRVWPSRGE
jgi:hypothetical protein